MAFDTYQIYRCKEHLQNHVSWSKNTRAKALQS